MRRTDEYVAWLLEARISLAQQKPGGICKPYSLSITAARPDKRRRDIDNLIKPISDALVHANIIPDDSLCQKVSAQWAIAGEGVNANIQELP